MRSGFYKTNYDWLPFIPHWKLAWNYEEAKTKKDIFRHIITIKHFVNNIESIKVIGLEQPTWQPWLGYRKWPRHRCEAHTRPSHGAPCETAQFEMGWIGHVVRHWLHTYRLYMHLLRIQEKQIYISSWSMLLEAVIPECRAKMALGINRRVAEPATAGRERGLHKKTCKHGANKQNTHASQDKASPKPGRNQDWRSRTILSFFCLLFLRQIPVHIECIKMSAIAIYCIPN